MENGFLKKKQQHGYIGVWTWVRIIFITQLTPILTHMGIHGWNFHGSKYPYPCFSALFGEAQQSAIFFEWFLCKSLAGVLSYTIFRHELDPSQDRVRPFFSTSYVNNFYFGQTSQIFYTKVWVLSSVLVFFFKFSM